MSFLLFQSVARLQGGGTVKWKSVQEKKRPHHPSSIQLPAVYETWKQPSRLTRRKAKAAAASRRTTRSVPSLSRREDSDGPSRTVSSAPPSKPAPNDHDKQSSDGAALIDKGGTPPRLPKLNTLVNGAVSSDSSSDSPSVPLDHSRPRDRGTKTDKPVSNDETSVNATTTRDKEKLPKASKKAEIHHANDGAVSPKKKETKITSLENEKPQRAINNEKTAHEARHKYLSNRDKPEKIDSVPEKTATISVKPHTKTSSTAQVKTKSSAIDDTHTKSTPPKHVSESKRPQVALEKKREKLKPKKDDNSTVHSDAHGIDKQTLNKAKTESSISVGAIARSSPLRTSDTRDRSTHRVNARSKSDVTKRKPPLLRRQTKHGHFTASGEFVAANDDGEQSEISAVTAATKDTKTSTTSRRSHASNASSGAKTKDGAKKPFKRRPVIITKKTLARQKFYNSVYNNQRFKLQRQVIFLKKVENAQEKIHDDRVRQAQELERRKSESIVKQYQALKHIRDRFDEEQVKRFSRQYVSWRSVETDRLKRNSVAYGLPDNIYEDRYDKTLKELPTIKKAPQQNSGDKKFSRFARWVKNIKKFELILKPNTGAGLEDSLLQSTKGALVEGKDIVELHESSEDGGGRTKQVKVRNVLGSARRLLKATQDMDAISEVSDEASEDERENARLGINDFNIDDDDLSSLDLSDDDEKGK
ncbi:uncharacterized protein [Diadema antillarum]|uniref:uncharacterized protein n=1 Tax=Diadema antillarum TaxID=105358 RepID=UPI003A836D70